MFNRQQPHFGRNSFASFMEQQQDEGDHYDHHCGSSSNRDSCSTDHTPSLGCPAVTPPHQPLLKYTSPMKLVRVSDAFSNYRNSITVATNPFCCIYGKVTMSRVVVEYPTSPLTPLTPGSPPSTQHSSGHQHLTSLQTGVSPATANYHHQFPTPTSSILPPMPTHFFYLKVDDVAPTLLSQEREQHSCFSREAQKRREERRGRDSSTSVSAAGSNHCPEDHDDDGREGELPNSAIIKVCGSYEFTTRAQKSIKVGGRYFFCITGSTPARRPCHLDSRLVPGQLLCCERFRKKELMAYPQNGDTSFMIASSEYRNVPNEIAVRRGYWSYSKSLPSAVQFGSWANSRTEAKRDRASWGYGLGTEEEDGDDGSRSRQQDDHPQSTAFIDQEEGEEHRRSMFSPVHFGSSHPACTSSIQSSSSYHQKFQQTKPQTGSNSSFSAAVGAAFSRSNNGFGKQQSALDYPSTSLSFGRSSTFTTGNNGPPSSDTSSENSSSSDPSSQQQQRYIPPELEAE